MVGLRGAVFFGQWSVVGVCSHSSSLIVFTHLYCRISIVCGIVFFRSTSILTLTPPTIHTYYTTYFSTEIYQSESGWQKESHKSSLCTPGLATVSNLILFCVLIWLKKWPLGKFGTFDTQVLANYKDNIITSPNCNFIPEPFCFKDNHIMPLCDGRFSLVDCFQWSQLHAEQYIWSACIPRQVVYRDDPIWSILWWNMSWLPNKFVLEQGSAFEVGRVHKSKFQQLEKVHRCLDECAQKWLTENLEYKGPLNLQEWVQCCSWALICLEVRNYVLCLWNTGVFQIIGPEFGALRHLYKAWGLVNFSVCQSCYILLIVPISLATSIHISWHCFGCHSVPVMTMPNPYLGLVVTLILVRPLPSS